MLDLRRACAGVDDVDRDDVELDLGEDLLLDPGGQGHEAPDDQDEHQDVGRDGVLRHPGDGPALFVGIEVAGVAHGCAWAAGSLGSPGSALGRLLSGAQQHVGHRRCDSAGDDALVGLEAAGDEHRIRLGPRDLDVADLEQVLRRSSRRRFGRFSARLSGRESHRRSAARRLRRRRTSRAARGGRPLPSGFSMLTRMRAIAPPGSRSGSCRITSPRRSMVSWPTR